MRVGVFLQLYYLVYPFGFFIKFSQKLRQVKQKKPVYQKTQQKLKWVVLKKIRSYSSARSSAG